MRGTGFFFLLCVSSVGSSCSYSGSRNVRLLCRSGNVYLPSGSYAVYLQGGDPRSYSSRFVPIAWTLPSVVLVPVMWWVLCPLPSPCREVGSLHSAGSMILSFRNLADVSCNGRPPMNSPLPVALSWASYLFLCSADGEQSRRVKNVKTSFRLSGLKSGVTALGSLTDFGLSAASW